MSDDNVVARLNRLERSNRRLKALLALGVAGSAAAFFLSADARQQTVTAENFRLVDRDGKIRAILGQDPEGTFFYLNDENGKMRVSAAAQKNGGFYNVKDENGKTRVLMSYDEGGAVLRSQDPAGVQSTLIVDQRGPAMHLKEDTGRIRIIAPYIDVLEEPRREDPQDDRRAPAPPPPPGGGGRPIDPGNFDPRR